MIWSSKDLEIIYNNYGKVPIQDWEGLLSRNRTAIQKKAQKLGLKADYRISQQRYTHNKYYFNSIGMENSYWAGFIAADGCLVQGKKPNDKSVRITIHNKDIDILSSFIKCTEFTGKITGNKYKTVSVFGAREWYSDLYKYWNLTNNKSLTLIPPNLKMHSDEALAFIRGYIDGDGSITNHNNKLYFSVCGTLEMVSWIKKNIGIDNKINLNGNSQTNYSYRIAGKTAKLALNKLLYIDVPFNMHRKWDNLL